MFFCPFVLCLLYEDQPGPASVRGFIKKVGFKPFLGCRGSPVLVQEVRVGVRVGVGVII